MYELEEMMLEENPLYKKKSRLKKEEQRRKASAGVEPMPGSIEDQLRKVELTYAIFNREKVYNTVSFVFLGCKYVCTLLTLRSIYIWKTRYFCVAGEAIQHVFLFCVLHTYSFSLYLLFLSPLHDTQM